MALPNIRKTLHLPKEEEEEFFPAIKRVDLQKKTGATAATDIEIIKNFLWEDCKQACDASDYGFDVPDGKNITEVNHEEFGVFNGEDALAKSFFDGLLIIEGDQDEYANNYGFLHFDNEWNSHLTTVVMKNGSIVGCGDSGLWLGEYE